MTFLDLDSMVDLLFNADTSVIFGLRIMVEKSDTAKRPSSYSANIHDIQNVGCMLIFILRAFFFMKSAVV